MVGKGNSKMRGEMEVGRQVTLPWVDLSLSDKGNFRESRHGTESIGLSKHFRIFGIL